MKRIISLALALLMIAVSMAACSKKDNNGGATTPVETIPSTPAATVDTTPTTTPETTAPEGESADVVFTNCDELVYVVDAKMLNLRKAPNFNDDSLVGTVEYGTELRRIGVSDTWSKVVYNNAEYYVSSKYVSTVKPLDSTTVFTEVNETVYVLRDANYRSVPSLADSTIVDTIAKGTAITRTGIAYDTENDPEGLGWSRVEIEGKTYYMRNSVLSTTAPAETPAATTAAAN